MENKVHRKNPQGILKKKGFKGPPKTNYPKKHNKGQKVGQKR